MSAGALTRLARVLFPPLTAARVAAKQAERATIAHLEHAAIAEEHAALAAMYAARVKRLGHHNESRNSQ